ncbi:MAG: beta-glucosidase BglX [Kiloniellaceae bacterium]
MDISLDNLLARMTLADKIGQLNHPNANSDATTGAGEALGNVESRIRRGEVGSLPGGAEPSQVRALQRIAVEESPQGIPLIFTFDVIHGYRTVFPLPLGLACAWDSDLVRRTAQVAAAEAAGEGIALSWAPMLDVSRDARWGRCAESPGEDPLLGAAFGAAMVAGFQGEDLTRPQTVMATAKHFAGYGLSEAGRDYNAVDASPYRMHNVVLPPFKTAVESGVGAIMVGFHDLAGIPCTAHRELLRDLLRERWGFDGLLVSDYTAILELIHHGVAADPKEAACLAFNAGVDIDLMSGFYLRYLPELVAEGRIAETEIDAACRRVLQAKQKLGLFDHPYRGLPADDKPPATLAGAHRRLAREAAAKACVLLKNDGVLPLRSDGGTLAVIGPLADSRANMQGTWAPAARPADSITLLEGIQAVANGRCRIVHALGTNIVDDPDIAARLNVFNETFVIDRRPPAELIAEAVAVAQQADVVVAGIGEAKEHAGESSTRSEIGLPGSQGQLLRALHATGKPLVVVSFSGRPLDLEWEDRHANAVLHVWFGGSEAGNGVADVLFGAVTPSGKLAMSFPRGAGQCPTSYAEAPTGGPRDRNGIDVAGDQEVDGQGHRVFRKFTTACRLEGPSTPLYPFGYGIGYSAFEYGPLEVDKTQLRGEADRLTVTVAVRNAGTRAGEEIVQLYIGDPVASRSRPLRELKGFRKILLQPGAQQRVSFAIGVADLRFFKAERLAAPEPVWEPGTFVVEVGASSQALAAATIEWQADR